MRAKIKNKIGVTVEIPDYDEHAYRYHEFYMDKAGRVICQNIAKRKWPVQPPYTIYKRHLGTDETTIKEVLE